MEVIDKKLLAEAGETRKKTSECALYITASLRVRVSFNERAVWYGALIFIYRPKNR